MPITQPVNQPAGKIEYFAMSAAPAGWIKANGAAVGRSAYTALFTAIGTVYGVGDGATTFNLPDLRGEFARGYDDGRGIDSGRAIGSFQADALKSHTHTYTSPQFGGLFVNASSPTGGGDGQTAAVGDVETRPRNVALLACIKY